MSSTEALRKPSKDYYNMVAFRYGAAGNYSWYKITDWSRDIVSATPGLGGVYTSQPSLEIRLPGNSGTLKDSTIKLVVPRTTFFDRLSNGEPHSPVKVYVMEYDKERTTDSIVLMMFIGWLFVSETNYSGKPDRILLECGSWKKIIDQKAGRPCVAGCINNLGDTDCGIDVETAKETATLTVVEAKTVTISGLSAQSDRYWHRGYVEYLGLRIGIRDWTSGTTFELAREPPSDWEGVTVTVAPGCDKDIVTCRDIWNNESQFNGTGSKVAARNPVFEQR